MGIRPASSVREGYTHDSSVSFPAVLVKGRKGSKTDQRRVLSDYAIMWITNQHTLGVPGCIVFDIDDTLIDGNETARWGFEFMVDFYKRIFHMYPVHIVTARPNTDHDHVMVLLKKKGIFLPPDRLHMIPEKQWGDNGNVEKFKWSCHERFVKMHGSVIAKFGDKLWDVAHIESLRDYLGHIEDRDAYVFFDKKVGKWTLSVKLPGA